MHYDAIVVGSGPAGSAAALTLARAGRSVLVLEKGRHPRHKSCGGGLSARLLPYLDEDVRAVVERTVLNLSFRFKDKEVTVSSSRPVAYLVVRSRFDAYLADKARKAGAEIHEASPMFDWRETPERIEVQSRSGRDTASFLIGADGATSRVARRLSPGWKKHLAFSIETEVPFRSKEESVWIDLTMPKGYGWVFPKASGAAIGIADFGGKVNKPYTLYHDFLERQRDLLERYRLLSSGPSGEEVPPSGCTIPVYRRSSYPLAKGRVLLVGDAGGLVDPLFGEGIYYAVRSGQMAGRVVAAALTGAEGIESYDREIRSAFYPDFEAAAWMAKWVYAFPGLFLEMVQRYPKGSDLYLAILRGEGEYRRFWKEIGKAFLRKWFPIRNIAARTSRP